MPSFIHRLAAAFAISGTLSLALLCAVAFPRLFRDNNGPLDFWGQVVNGFDALAVCLAIAAIAIFLVAFPVERWLVKPATGRIMAAGYYALAFGALAGVGIALTVANRFAGYLPITLASASVVGGLVAIIGRLLYPSLVRFKKTAYGASVVLIVLGLLGPALPQAEQNAVVGQGIFPDILAGEVARGTYNTNHRTGVMGTGFYEPGSVTRGRNYVLKFGCVNTKKPLVYTADIQNAATYSQAFETEFVCQGATTHEVAVRFSSNFKPRVMLYPKVDTYGHYTPDAYAILVPKLSR
jgi:hypothetical protein